MRWPRPSLCHSRRWLTGHRLLRTLAILLGVNTFCGQLGNARLVRPIGAPPALVASLVTNAVVFLGTGRRGSALLVVTPVLLRAMRTRVRRIGLVERRVIGRRRGRPPT